MRVLILGCGPAGLIAAHAAYSSGVELAILSKARKSYMKGAQYLHSPIPGIDCGDPFDIKYTLRGSPAAYRAKVYGPRWDGSVSPEDLEESHRGWDIRRAYDRLWDAYGHLVTDWEASPGGLRDLLKRDKPDLVVSSIPAPLLCVEGHQFAATRVWSNDYDFGIPTNEVVCNGEDSPQWYRASNIQGHHTVEWPGEAAAKPPFTPMWGVSKPLRNNCTCFPEIVRTGRYGRWEKGVLSDAAWHDTYRAIRAIEEDEERN